MKKIIAVVCIIGLTILIGSATRANAYDWTEVTLENTGPSAFSEIILGFDIPPVDPGQTLDVTVGSPYTLFPPNIGNFYFGGIPVSRDNPLLPGGTASTGPLSQLIPGTYVDFELIDSFGSGFSIDPYIEIIPNATTITFDLSHPYVTGGKLSGTFRFTSVAPEPISSILFVTGGSLLAGRRFIRRKA